MNLIVYNEVLDVLGVMNLSKKTITTGPKKVIKFEKYKMIFTEIGNPSKRSEWIMVSWL